MPDAAPLLSIADLSIGMRLDGRRVAIVDGVNLEVRRGETVGLVGESGCGKSTTALASAGLIRRASRPHTSGRVLFEGQDLLAMSEEELCALRGRAIGMILQDPMTSLNPVLTVGDQIAEVIDAHAPPRLHAGREERRQRVLELLRQVQIPSPETRLAQYPHQLSGGMKQRIAGAIAIACRPKLLIADEPTTALDVTVQAQYLALLKQLQAALDMALMLITHDFGVVARMCERVYVMYAGQIVEAAGVHDIFERPAHWYSAALIGGLPALDRRDERLMAVAGSPPVLGSLPGGCAFAPRCPRAEEKCRSMQPPLAPVDDGRQVRCWFPRAADTPRERGAP